MSYTLDYQLVPTTDLAIGGVFVLDLTTDPGNVIVLDAQGSGPPGPKGDPGPAGQGITVGGTAGQVWTKKSPTDYDADWVNAASGGPAGGVLAGTYPNPTFAVDMVTQAELDTGLASYLPLTGGTVTGAVVLTPNAVGVKPLVVKGIAAQTSKLTEWQDSGGVVRASIGTAGETQLATLGVGLGPGTDRLVNVQGTPPGGQTITYGVVSDPVLPATTTATFVALTGRVRSVAATFTTATAMGLWVQTPVLGAGHTVSNVYGINVHPQTGGTGNHAIVVAEASTSTLWLASGTNPTTPSGGIIFGSSRDTNLYRSAAGTLKTDGALTAAGAVTVDLTGKPAVVGLDVKAASGQTANLTNWRDGTGLLRAFIDPAGYYNINSNGVFDRIFNANVVGKAQPTFYFLANGTMFFSDGTNAGDLGVSRGAAGRFDVSSGTAPAGLWLRGQGGTGGVSTATQFLVSGPMRDQFTHGQACIAVTDAMAIDTGGSISFAGQYLAAGNNITPFGRISAYKENATDGDVAGYMSLWTRPNGGNATERLRITSTGDVRVLGGNLVVTGTGNMTVGGNIGLSATGAKIGLTAAEKLAFWGKAPIVQPTTAIAGAAFVAGTGTAVQDTSTFDGYTMKQVVAALRAVGVLA